MLRALKSVTPNICCDKTELRRIHSPDNTILNLKVSGVGDLTAHMGRLYDLHLARW